MYIKTCVRMCMYIYKYIYTYRWVYVCVHIYSVKKNEPLPLVAMWVNLEDITSGERWDPGRSSYSLSHVKLRKAPMWKRNSGSQSLGSCEERDRKKYCPIKEKVLDLDGPVGGCSPLAVFCEWQKRRAHRLQGWHNGGKKWHGLYHPHTQCT